jgi:hypothetical protein
MHPNRVTVHVLEHSKDSPAIKAPAAGTTIFKAGTPPTSSISSSTVRPTSLVGKRIFEVTVRRDLLGEVALIDGKLRSAIVVTIAREARVGAPRRSRRGAAARCRRVSAWRAAGRSPMRRRNPDTARVFLCPSRQ